METFVEPRNKPPPDTEGKVEHSLTSVSMMQESLLLLQWATTVDMKLAYLLHSEKMDMMCKERFLGAMLLH